MIPPGFDTTGIRDSKLLSAKQREAAFDRIVEACAFAVAKAEPPALDRRGLHRSNIALLRRAARALEPDYALTDGFPVPRMPCPSLGIKKGDMVSASVAAASIIAKVTRDRIMLRLDRRYPAFGFCENKGYATLEHRDAIEVHGPSPVHRLSFAGVGQPALPGSRADRRSPSVRAWPRWTTGTSSASKRNARWSCTGSTATCSRCSPT